MNRQSNKDRLLSMVQGLDPDLSPRPILYDLRDYGGVNLLLSSHFISDTELRTLAKEDREEFRDILQELLG